MDLKAKLKNSLIQKTQWWTIINNEIVQNIIQRTFLWTGWITAIVFAVAYYIVWMIQSWSINMGQYSTAFWISMILWLVLVVVISLGYQKMNYATVATLTLLFAGLEWVWLAWILSMYSAASVVNAFAGAALLFIVMWIYGYVTKTDLTKMGTILLVWLITLIILEVINMFIWSSQFEMILSAVWLLIFLWLTAWDLQMLKQMAETWDIRLEMVFW